MSLLCVVQILVEDLRCQVEQAFDDVTISHDEYERLKELKQSDLAVSQLVKVCQSAYIVSQLLMSIVPLLGALL